MEYSRQLSLVLPLYNEEDNATGVLKSLSAALKKEGLDYEIIAVDNGSRDGTGAVLRKLSDEDDRMVVVTVTVNEGYGKGVLAGLKKCSGRYAGFMDCDGQISPNDAIRVYRKLIDEDLDLCTVNRIVREDGLSRKIMTVGYNRIASLLLGIGTSDINAVPKIMKHEILDQLELKSKDWFIDTEILLKLNRIGATVGEVDVEFKSRKKGSSHIRFIVIFEFLKNIIKYRILGTR